MSTQTFLIAFSFCFILLTSPAVAQPFPCGVSLTNSYLDTKHYQPIQVNETGEKATSITYVPIRPHILRRTDGTGGYSLADLNQVMSMTNNRFLRGGTGIQFFLAGESPDYIDDTGYYELFDENALGNAYDVNNALNQYYINPNSRGIATSFAYYPANYVFSTRSLLIVESGQFTDELGNYAFPHELGHNFGLIHTHGDYNPKELVTRGSGANCGNAGDYVCDTPADPFGMMGVKTTFSDGCTQYDTSSTARDANGERYFPLTSNLMSYYYNTGGCRQEFTPGQAARLQANLALRQAHTAYTLDFPPAIVPAASGVSASYQSGSVTVTWQDNAGNEMGYFIERSGQPEAGFEPIGGVGPNSTSFTDVAALADRPYYYRVRPSNTKTDAISDLASIYTGTCQTMYTVKAGNWNDASVWSCGRVPTSADIVELFFRVRLPAGETGQAKGLIYGSSGVLAIEIGSRLLVE